jgi:hypothetical protein
VPDSGTTVLVERGPSHVFLAEYQRRVIVEIEARARNQHEMFADTGGYSRANLYRIDAGIALLRDADVSYTIDLTTGAVSKDELRQTQARSSAALTLMR